VLTGQSAHEEAVARLRASYDAIPDGQPVRLAKRTSNLFRPRTATHTPGLDVSGLGGVIAIDTRAQTADVQGMCTYEHLVDETLARGFIPYVVPQLRTITLGGAVSGLGIESTSFRNGLPHESVTEMDIFTGAGEVVTTRPGDDLFDTFPNSYGSLGYATRLRIKLEKVPSYVSLRHVRFDDVGLLAKTIADIVANREYDGVRVDGLDGTAFEPGEYYLSLATWTDDPEGGGRPSDYTGRQIYYRSIQQRERDVLTMYDYLWRWDTDWFWCSRAFGAQHPVVRRLWPRRWKRSDVYYRLVGLDQRLQVGAWLERRRGNPEGERVVQDVEVPVERLGDFLDWFDEEVGMRPVWLCPLVSTGSTGGSMGSTGGSMGSTGGSTGSTGGSTGSADGKQWPTYPLAPHEPYVNVGFWGNVPVGPEASDAPRNRAIEAKVHELGGHKSLYSEAFYDRETFDQLYDGPNLARVKDSFDPEHRLTSLYDKAVRRR
jgi:FAD/FMN-containing dehydrogenase